MASYTYDPVALRYRAPGGQFLAESQVRAGLDYALQASERRVRAMALQLRARAISTSEFSLEMRAAIKDTQLYAAALGSGGWASMTPQLYGGVGRRIRTEYAYLDQMMGEIRNGQQPLDGNFVVRATLYIKAAWATWTVFVRLAALAAGRTQERNIRQEDQENCQMCREQSDRGWVPIGTLVPIGDRTCLRRDRCYMEYR